MAESKRFHDEESSASGKEGNHQNPFFMHLSSASNVNVPSLSISSDCFGQWGFLSSDPLDFLFSSSHSYSSSSSSSSSCFVLMKDDRMAGFKDIVSHGPLSSTTIYSFHNLNTSHRLLLLTLLAIPLFYSSPASAACSQSDRDSLLSFFDSLSASPPLNWSSSTDCCDWEGTACQNIGDGDEDRVTELLLSSRGLNGVIPLSLANLTYLSRLDLSRNRLNGSIPSSFFSSLNRLQFLNLSYNILFGQLPSPSSTADNFGDGLIQILDLSSNRFSGIISSSFIQGVAKSGSLVSFNISNNGFTGPVPTSFCSNTSLNSSLRRLDLSLNGFSGQIAAGLGECSNLVVFRAGFNKLSGPIPSDLYDCVELEEISLPLNSLGGTISDDIFRLGNLKFLELYSNQLIGSIPDDIGKLSNLEELHLHINNFTGTVPSSLMNCSRLTILNLRVNALQGELAVLDFSKLSRLTTLDLGNNKFTGVIPPTLYWCTSLKAVRLSSNRLTGEILPGIQALQSLTFLSISRNNLSNLAVAIRSLVGCKNLGTLVLSQSYSGEELPDGDGIVDPNSFQNIQLLALGACNLTGRVPSWIVNLKKLEALDISFNQLVGSIPDWLGDLPNLFYIDLSNNNLTGEFPDKFCSLPALVTTQVLDPETQSFLALPVFVAPNNASIHNQVSSIPHAIYLGNNSITGSIPSEIGQLVVIQILDLSHNNFSGGIPDTISNLVNLERLDLSNNHLTGRIPPSLRGLHFLSWFSVANNSLQGPVPVGGQFDTFPSSSYDGNPGLCGPPMVQRSCVDETTSTTSSDHHKSPSKKLIIPLVLGFCLVSGLIVGVIVFWILSKKRIIPGRDSEKIEFDSISYTSDIDVDKDASTVMLFPNNADETKELTIYDILAATDNFSQENIVGCGGFGLVYKAILTNGTKLAVKKLSGDMGLMDREFKAEVEALSAARHENLVTLQGYCVHDGCRLLMYTYMENGSLDYWLHEKIDGPSQLDWATRLRIAQGASLGLAYMHQICEPHIVHRDIKSSNILLDREFKAHVADFGLSRLIDPYQTHVTTELVGTLGYIPPEYGQAWIATLRGDVYSFGVVLLELLTGKRPMEISRPMTSRDLVGWVQQMRKKGKEDEVFDPILKGKGSEEEMVRVLDAACMCVNGNPVKRLTIGEVVDWLKNIRSSQPEQNKYL